MSERSCLKLIPSGKKTLAYLPIQYLRITAGRNKERALGVLGHAVLVVIIYRLLTRRQPYHELGAACFDHLALQTVGQGLDHHAIPGGIEKGFRFRHGSRYGVEAYPRPGSSPNAMYEPRGRRIR